MNGEHNYERRDDRRRHNNERRYDRGRQKTKVGG
jgi:hypothetical protein